MSPNLSILIITYNRAEDTLALLKSLKAQLNWEAYIGEILLLNNNSSESYEIIEKFVAEYTDFPVKYIHHTENLGVARGRNFLIERAQFPILFVLDDDVILPDPKSIEMASGLFHQEKYISNNTAVITCNIFYFDTKLRQKNALPHKKFDKYKEAKSFKTYYFTGAAHLMKKELFTKTGLYPDNFFYGMEEYDLSYRIIDCGYSLTYDDSIVILHKESPKGRVSNKQKLELMWYNKTVVAWRYLPKKYFYSTWIMWGILYLIKSKIDLKNFIRICKSIRKIPNEIQSSKVSLKTLDYLKKVEARLWY